MPEWLTELFLNNPGYSYVLVAALFVLCGLGLPLPEEIVLVFAGYLCHQGHAAYPWMVVTCSGAILVGDIVPFLLGRMFGPRLLRLRWLRLVVNRERLAMFNRWFRRRGDQVILVARFVPGLRVVAFFTGGTMRMRWRRFMILDTLGIALTAPTFSFLGWHFGDKIDELFAWVRRLENSIFYLALAGGLILGIWYWLRRRVRRRQLVAGPRETFVEPTVREIARVSESVEAKPDELRPATGTVDRDASSGDAPTAESAQVSAPVSAPDSAPGSAPDPGPAFQAELEPELGPEPASHGGLTEQPSPDEAVEQGDRASDSKPRRSDVEPAE